LAYRLEMWDDHDTRIEELIALLADHAVARAAFAEAVRRRPGKIIILRQKSSAGGQSEGDTFVNAEGAQSTEGAHMKCMSIFEIDEHLQALAPSRMRYSGGETKRRLA
jgi:hypothetical protein